MKISFILIVLLLAGNSFAKEVHLPPVDKRMRIRVDFWKKVYTEIESQQGFIHDKEDMDIIYKKVDFKTRRHKQKARASRRAVREITQTMNRILKKNLKNLTSAELEILHLSRAKTKSELRQRKRNLRTQYGLKDNYYIGLKKSHRYLDYIKKVFADHGLPKELIYLPHVESSFNYQAYSKVGAAGIWQFMRSTARHYGMKVNYVIDERRDPFIATKAAARLLKYNYKKIQAWPLAITAYNHGLRSMQRAVSRVKSKEISDIIDGYDGRRFGFASKNFYATFIATVEISQNPNKYFSEFKKPSPFKYSNLKLKRRFTVSQISKALGIDKKTIKLYNPAIRRSAFSSAIALPRGYRLQLPQFNNNREAQYLSLLAAIPDATKNLKVAGLHKIRSGDNLYTIAKLYQVSFHDLITFNQITNPSRIFPGMKIKIPGAKDIAGLQKVATIKPAAPKREAPPEPPQIAATKSEPEQPVKKRSWFDKMFKKDPVKIAEKNSILEENEVEVKEQVITKQVSLDLYDLKLKTLGGNYFQITIETDETLGHYSDWSLTRMRKIRSINRLHARSTIRKGQKFKIFLNEETKKRFIAERAEYHLSLQEDFFGAYKVVGTEEYTIRSGDNLSEVLKKYEIPLWLLRKYQAKEFNENANLRIGDKLKIPVVEKIES